MKNLSAVVCVLGAVLAVQTLPASAGNSPRGDCALKNSKQRNEGYQACNAKHGTKPAPERSACIKDADAQWKTTEAECRKLSDKPADDPVKKK